MNRRLRIWPMKALAAFALACGLFPVSVILGRWLFPENRALWGLPMLFSFLWGAGGYLLPKKGRVPWTVLGSVLSVLFFALYPSPFRLQNLLPAVPCVVYLWLLPPAWARAVWEEWSPGLWIAGAGLQLAGQAFASRPAFSGVNPLLMIVFLLYAFLLLLSLNRSGIRDGMHGAEKAPAPIRRSNTALVFLVFLVAALASAWGALAQWLGTAWYYIRLGVGYVILFFMSLLPVNEASQGGQGMGMEGFGAAAEAAEPSAFALFMEKVFRVLAFILLSVLLFFALRALVKKLRQLWVRLSERLRLYAAASSEDYVDEAESTLNWEEKTQSIQDWMKERIRRAPKQPRWEELNGRERVRSLYRQYIRRRPEAQGATVREALQKDARLSRSTADAFARLYEQARYSDHDVSANDADQMRKQVL